MTNSKKQESFAGAIKKREQAQLRRIKLTFVVIVIIGVMIAVIITLKGCNSETDNYSSYDIPAYSNNAYEILNNNIPFFSSEEYERGVFEEYSDLDVYGRCGVAFANICPELMPNEPRGEIGQIKPSGWNQEKYPGVVDSEPPYLYNRCHLIGFQLAGENDNEKNLITGTRYFNVEGMLPYENKVREYVNETNNHVLYRVTPIYEGANLVASGVIMEAYSVEDSGKGISFNVFVHNVQPGVIIDYHDGSSRLEE